jgi:hypothetical protein
MEKIVSLARLYSIVRQKKPSDFKGFQLAIHKFAYGANTQFLVL